jgi:DNA-binding SARP family transcriptional activator/tetratricopeptide (TPR) repeat protein
VANQIRWEIRLCGRVAVSSSDGLAGAALPGRQGQLLLAYLVCHRTRACPRYELEDVLWPEDAPAASESALSSLLSKLRRALGPDALTGRAELRLSLPEPLWVDIEALADAVEVAVQALDDRRWSDAAAQARAALALGAEPFLAECDGRWVRERRREVEGLRLRALEALGEAGLRLGGRELDAAEHAARTAIGLAPFRESSHRLLMEVHEASGNPAEALRAFDELRQLLRDELGTAPGPAVMEVHERLLRGDAPPEAPVSRASAPGPLPAALAAATRRHAFVGRREALAALRGAWDAAVSDERRLVLVAGEAGIGKSRVAAEFTREVHRDGAVVLYGRFDETGPGAYGPVLEMLRGWSGGAALTGPAQRLGPRAADLAALLPELGAPASPSAMHGGDGGTERHRLFDALAALLAEIASGAPLLLVLDDLHWADSPTLQLVRHLIRAPQPRRAMFLGTYREGEVTDGHALADVVASLRREAMLTEVPLGGLAEAEVGELVAALGAEAPSPGFVASLHGETEGNPFFVEEVVRHLRESPDGLSGDLEDAGVPAGVREVTSRRIARLPASARDAMQVASVIGREFDFGLLEALGPLTGDELVSALDEAVAARVLKEVDGRVGRYAFAHALVRATLYDGLSALRRARLHSRVGETILARHKDDLDPWLPQLARHFGRAAPVEGPARAIDFALAAGRRADRLLAWEEAAQHYRGALRARQATSEARDRTGGELLLALGASEERAGMEAARETFATALSVARELDDPVLLARAALGAAGPWSTLGREDPAVVAALEEALGRLGEEDSPLRARLLARLSLELYYAGQPERRMALSEEAVALARRIGDPATLASALDARHYVLWRPENVDERLEVAAELRRIAEEIGDLELELEGAGWTVVDLLELGDVEGADVQIDAAAALAAVVHRPLYLWWTSLFRCTRAQLAGDFEQAEQLAGETLAIGQREHAENALHYYAMAMFNIRREQGRLGEVEDAVARFIEMYPAIPAWRCTQALMHVELGRMDAARASFEAVAGPGFDALPRDANWLIGLTLLAEVCGALGDAERARALYDLLAPHGGRNVLVGRAASCNGSASRLLGILAGVLGEWEEAERRFFEAREMHVRMGARPWLARTELAWAEMLLARGEPADEAAARERLAEAIVIADALGMVAVAERARALVTGGEPVRSRA